MKKIILMKIFFSVMKIFFLWVVKSGQYTNPTTRPKKPYVRAKTIIDMSFGDSANENGAGRIRLH